GARAIHSSAPDNVLTRGHLKCGDVNAGFACAAATAEGAFATQFVEHAYIEPEAGYAVPVGDGRIEVVACTQAPYMDLEETARACASAPRRVAAASVANSMSRCSRCWQWRRGSHGAPCAWSTRAPNRWPPPPSATPRASKPRRRRTPTVD